MQQAHETEALPLQGAHWPFVVALYARPGVSQACLLLQDRAGVDVNILLFALYAAVERGVVLAAHELQEMDAAVAAWRNDIILPLRSVRRRLKTGPEPAPGDKTEVLRTQVKSCELDAERVELAVLMRWLGQRSGQPERRPGALDALVQQVVAYFATRSSAPAAGRPDTGDTKHAMELLVEQAAAPG
jgi:uncharacterized protein (TIGR02444 family)